MYKFIAHRGNDDDLAENSKEAILNSLSKPYIDGVEFDIRITKDNKFVINHNATINLNSNKIGTIKNMTLKQLKKVKFKNHNMMVTDFVIPLQYQHLIETSSSKICINYCPML